MTDPRGPPNSAIGCSQPWGAGEGQAGQACNARKGLSLGGLCAWSVLWGNHGSHRAMGWVGQVSPKPLSPIPGPPTSSWPE